MIRTQKHAEYPCQYCGASPSTYYHNLLREMGRGFIQCPSCGPGHLDKLHEHLIYLDRERRKISQLGG